MNNLEIIETEVLGELFRFQWRSENGSPMPQSLMKIDDTTSADLAFKSASSGQSMLWVGDFQNARHLLQAMSRRFDKSRKFKSNNPRPSRNSKKNDTQAKAEAEVEVEVSNLNRLITHQSNLNTEYKKFRDQQKLKAQILGRLLIAVQTNHLIDLRRAPNVLSACSQAYGEDAAPYIVSLRELMGVISAYEWRKKGVVIDLNEHGLSPFKISPHYGVFSPIRGEYLELIAKTHLPSALTQDSTAFDIGTGTGVLSIILAKRGVKFITATDQNTRAIDCALSNVDELNLENQIAVIKANLFPPSGKAALIVCNPPWLPTQSSTSVDTAVFDPNSQMLIGFLNGLADHLLHGGEGWLIMSNFAELLGLRAEGELLKWIDEAGLVVHDRQDVRPVHRKAMDASDPFYKARVNELTSLWRLKSKSSNS